MGLRESAIFLVGYIEGLRADRDVPAHIRAHIDSVLDSPPELHVKIGQIEVSGPADKVLEVTSEKSDNLNTSDESVQKNAEIEHEDPPKKYLQDDYLSEVLELCNRPMAFCDIAGIFNCTTQTVKNYLKRHGHNVDQMINFAMRSGAIEPASEEEKDRLRRQAKMMQDAKKANAVQRTTVSPATDADSSQSFKNDGAITTKKHAGTSIGFVDDNDWPDIKKRLAAGVSQTTLAHDYEVDESTMDLFVRRKKREELNPGE